MTSTLTPRPQSLLGLLEALQLYTSVELDTGVNFSSR